MLFDISTSFLFVALETASTFSSESSSPNSQQNHREHKRNRQSRKTVGIFNFFRFSHNVSCMTLFKSCWNGLKLDASLMLVTLHEGSEKFQMSCWMRARNERSRKKFIKSLFSIFSHSWTFLLRFQYHPPGLKICRECGVNFRILNILKFASLRKYYWFILYEWETEEGRSHVSYFHLEFYFSFHSKHLEFDLQPPTLILSCPWNTKLSLDHLAKWTGIAHR